MYNSTQTGPIVVGLCVLTDVCVQKTSARLIDTHLCKCRNKNNLVLWCYNVFTVWVASVYLEAAAQDTGCNSFECFQCWS